MTKANPKIIVILGPTSSGKSDLAIRIARKFNGEIVSVDSRQVYRGMNIGTGKVSKKEQKLVKHWLLDKVDPNADYNVSEFKKDAEKVIQDILNRGKLPIICGGTGFWISAIVDNKIFPEVKPNKELRKKIEKYSAEKLFLMLKKLDSERAENIDKHNKVRLIRAIEICKELGKVPRVRCEINNTKYSFLQLGINLPKEQLHKNIKIRLEKRFKQGLIKEVKNLHKKYNLGWKKIQSFGLAYYWVPLFLQGKISKEELFEKVFQSEKDYAKRQLTWFKRDKRIRWINDTRNGMKLSKIFMDK